MNLEQQGVFVSIIGALIALGLAPRMTIYLRNRKNKAGRKWGFPVAMSVFVSWALQIIYRVTCELPMNAALARSHGDFEYDGVGGNVAILFAGWVYPLLTCGIMIAGIRIYESIQKKRNTA